MGLSIKNEETERLVRELARREGVGMTTAIHRAVADRLKVKAKPPRDPEAIMAAIRKIQAEISKMPILDDRADDEIIGYDEFGLPN
jgi:antitoxin VapB